MFIFAVSKPVWHSGSEESHGKQRWSRLYHFFFVVWAALNLVDFLLVGTVVAVAI